MRLFGLLRQPPRRLQGATSSLPGMTMPDGATPEEPTADGSESADNPELQFRASGVFTAISLYAILVVIALHLDGYSALWRATVGTFTGSLMEARVIDHSLLGLLGAVGAVVTIAVPLCGALGALAHLIHGSVKSHGVAKMFSGVNRHYFVMTAIVTVEELFARLLFLGVPLWIGGGHLPLWLFWVLFLTGNAIWALVHLKNFKDPKERHLLRVLPQFVAGAFLTVVFINFGFFGALIVHLAYNNLLFSSMRKGIFNRGEFMAILWHGLVAAVSAFFLIHMSGKSLLDMAYWLNSNATSYSIPGWSTTDYLWGVLLATSLLFIIGDLMLFDVYRSDDQKHVYDNLLRAIAVIVFAFGAFFGLEFLGTPFEMRVAVIALIFMVIYRSASGSGMSRVFFVGIPWLMILLCTTLALGFASPVWFILLAVALVEVVDDIIRIKDRKAEEASGSTLGLIFPGRSK